MNKWQQYENEKKKLANLDWREYESKCKEIAKKLKI